MKQATLLLGVATAGAAVAAFVFSKQGTPQDQQKKFATYLGGVALVMLGANYIITRP